MLAADHHSHSYFALFYSQYCMVLEHCFNSSYTLHLSLVVKTCSIRFLLKSNWLILSVEQAFMRPCNTNTVADPEGRLGGSDTPLPHFQRPNCPNIALNCTHIRIWQPKFTRGGFSRQEFLSWKDFNPCPAGLFQTYFFTIWSRNC